jgi:hypothetical protein
MGRPQSLGLVVGDGGEIEPPRGGHRADYKSAALTHEQAVTMNRRALFEPFGASFYAPIFPNVFMPLVRIFSTLHETPDRSILLRFENIDNENESSH